MRAFGTGARPLLVGAFAVVVVGHWAEHLLQAAQIWWLGWPRPAAGGALGLVVPDAVENESLHTGYNAALLVGIVLLLRGFDGGARRWWQAALVAQGWHLAEHLLLWTQAVSGVRPFATAAPASLGQLLVPRVELHLAYNTAVTVLLAVALISASRRHRHETRPGSLPDAGTPAGRPRVSNADSNSRDIHDDPSGPPPTTRSSHRTSPKGSPMRVLEAVSHRSPRRAAILTVLALAASLLAATAPPAAGDHAAFERVDGIDLDSEVFSPTAAVIDPDGAFAYFGTNTSPGRVVKVDLATFEEVDAIVLEDGEDFLLSAVIDPHGAFAYFGTGTSPGRVVKIDLTSFERVGVVALDESERILRTAVMDPAGAFAYFATAPFFDLVVKVDLSTFERVDALAVPTGRSAVIAPDGAFAYFGTDGRVVSKVDLETFERVDSIVLEGNETHLAAGVVDPDGAFAYFGTDTTASEVVKIDLATFERADGIRLNDGSHLRSAVIDPRGDFAYFGTGGAPARVVKIDLVNFEEAGAITLGSEEWDQRTAVIHPGGGFAYFGSGAAPGRVVKIDLTASERVGAIKLAGDERRLSLSAIDADGHFAYFGTDTAPGHVVKVDLATFERVDAINLQDGENFLRSAVIDPTGTFVYFGTRTSPGRVVKVDLATFERVDAITLPEDEDFLVSAVIDPAGEFAYFGTATAPGRIVKIDLDTFERVDAITLADGENLLRSAVIDPAGQFAYFGTSSRVVVKVDLDAFKRDNAITLPVGEHSLWSAVIDPSGDFAYFGTDTSPGRVIEVDLRTFERVDGITLDRGENFLRSALIDPAGEFAYFGTFTVRSAARVVQVDLAALERVDAVTLEDDERALQSAVIDPAGEVAYFGTFTQPGRVVKVGLPLPPLEVTADAATVTVDEGSEAVTTGTVSGAGPLPLSASVGSVTDHGDGTWTWSHTPGDGPDDTQTVTVTGEDRKGQQAEASFDLVVDNVAPTVTVAGPAAVGEGATATYTYAVSDPGDDTHTFATGSPDCGEHGQLVGTPAIADGTFACSFPDGPTSSSVAVQVVDSDGAASDEASVEVTIANVAPTVRLRPGSLDDDGLSLRDKAFSVDEGRVEPFVFTVTDPGDDGFTVHRPGCGPGVIVEGSLETSADGGTFACLFPDGPASGSVQVGVVDDDGASGFAKLSVFVDNVATTVTLSADNPVAVNESTTDARTYRYTIADPGEDTVEAVDTGCGGAGTKVEGSDAFDDAGGSFSCVFADGPATATVSAAATDSDGDTGEPATQAVDVANVAPTVGEITAPMDPVAVDTAVDASAGFTDPGADGHTAVWDWGDGTTSTGEVDADTGQVSGSHVYAAPGVHTVTLTVTDDDGDAGTSVLEFVVVYDPEGGFVTGNGWIDSPPGAYADDPDASGDASFGFVSKYQRGASAPEGNTRFQFRAGGLRLRSTDYQWLVISGNRAQFKGSGTINRAGDYGFLLTAVDGDANGPDAEDRFRIKIWDRDSGEVVYDNQRGDDETAEATTALQRGSITIHRAD